MSVPVLASLLGSDPLLLLVATARQASEREPGGKDKDEQNEGRQSEIAHRARPGSIFGLGPHRPAPHPAQNKPSAKDEKEIEPKIGELHHSLSSGGSSGSKSPFGKRPLLSAIALMRGISREASSGAADASFQLMLSEVENKRGKSRLS